MEDERAPIDKRVIECARDECAETALSPTNICKYCGAQFNLASVLFQHLMDAHPAELDACLAKHFPDLFKEG